MHNLDRTNTHWDKRQIYSHNRLFQCRSWYHVVKLRLGASWSFTVIPNTATGNRIAQLWQSPELGSAWPRKLEMKAAQLKQSCVFCAWVQRRKAAENRWVCEPDVTFAAWLTTRITQESERTNAKRTHLDDWSYIKHSGTRPASQESQRRTTPRIQTLSQFVLA